MRLLLITTLFPPQNAPASLRMHGFAATWAAAGHDVSVLTAARREDQRGFEVAHHGYELVEVPYRIPRALGALRAGSKQMDHDDTPEAPSNARAWLRSQVIRRLRRVQERAGVFGAVRMPDLTDFWVRPALAWAATQRPWDAMVSSAGPYTTHLVARELRRRARARAWAADFRDLWTDNHSFTGLFPFTILERALEGRVLREADLLTTISDPLADRLARRAGRAARVITNGFNPALAAILASEPVFPRDGLNRLVFTGTVYLEGNDGLQVMESLARLRADDPVAADRLRLVIAGPKRAAWLELAQRCSVQDLVEHRGEVDRATALRLQRDASVLLILDWNKPQAGVLTSKLFEYLFAGPPILAVGGSADSAIGRVLAETGVGIHLGGDVGAIARALGQLTKGELRLRRPPRAALERHTIQHQAARYLDLLDPLVRMR